MGGSSPAGTTTVTQNNTPFNAAQLTQVQNQALNLGSTDPINYYPGTTYALPDNTYTGALNSAEALGSNAGNATSNLVPGAQSTALNTNTALAGGGAYGLASPYLNSLQYTASGAMLGSNPYLSSEFNAQAQPVTNAFMTATAPQTDSQFEQAGGYGGSQNNTMQSVNQQNLGTTLNNLASNLYNTNYENEENNMVTAANEGANNVNSLANTTENAVTQTPTLTTMPTTDYQTAVNAGSQTQQLNQNVINDAISRFYGNEMAPWTTLQSEAGVVGGAIPGESTTTEPYFTNPTGQILGGLVGANSLLGSSGGLGTLMGK